MLNRKKSNILFNGVNKKNDSNSMVLFIRDLGLKYIH